MSFTSKYIITNSSGSSFLDFDLDFEELTFQGQTILFSGSSQVDGFYIRPGLSMDVSNSKGSSDIIRITGNFLDYVGSISKDENGLIIINKTQGGSTQTITLLPARIASDQIIFDDFSTSVASISNALVLNTQTETLAFTGNASDYLVHSQIDDNGHLDIANIIDGKLHWMKVNVNSYKTLQFNDGVITVRDFAQALTNTDVTFELDITQQSEDLSSQIVVAESIDEIDISNSGAEIKAISFDAAGETFSGFGQDTTLNISGGNGIDLVYIKAGSVVDATNLKGSRDKIYFTGEWSEYTKAFDNSGNVTFSRDIDIDGEIVTEQVIVSNGSVVATRDILIFLDGSVNTRQASTALSDNLNVELTAIDGVDASLTTPLVNDAPTISEISSQLVVIGQSFSLDLNSVVNDANEDDTITLSLEGDLPEGLSFSDGVISGTPSTVLADTTFTLTAEDTGGLSVTQDFNLQSVEAPAFSGISVLQGTESIAKADDSLTVVASISQNFTLQLNGATPTLTLAFGEESVSATYSSHDMTANTVTFTATTPDGDASGLTLSGFDLGEAVLKSSATDVALSNTVTGVSDTRFVLDNTAPNLTASSFTIAENTTIVGTLTTNETATMSLGTGDDSALFTLTDGVLSLNTAPNFESDDTTLTVNVDVVDTAGNTATQAVSVTVSDVNEAPSAQNIEAQTIVVGQAFTLDANSVFSDVDTKDTLTISLEGDLPEGLSLSDGVISGTPVPITERIDNDTLSFTISATDSGGLVAETELSVSFITNPVLSSQLVTLSSLNHMLDVRSDIVLQVNQPVAAVTGKTITFTDNTTEGYQGEERTNSFIIVADSDLVTIDNENGLIIINVDENFDLDLSSNYTMSIDTGAFTSVDTGLASATVSDITFDTVTPTAGEDKLSGLGEIDESASIKAYLPVYLQTPEGSEFVSLPEVAQIPLATLAWDALTDEEQAPYKVVKKAAQSYMMNTSDGSLVESAEWVDIEGLGIGTSAGLVSSLTTDIESESVFEFNASASDYVFVFSDQNADGGDENVGAGIATNTDLAVFIDEFGAGDRIYVDDSFNDADNINELSFEFFANGKGGEGTELFIGLIGSDGDPRLFVGLEGDTESTDENGNADSTLDGVNSALELEDDISIVITA